MEPLEQSVRDQIALFVEGYLSADRLNDLLPDTWAMDQAGEPAAIELIMLTLGYLAEYQSGVRQEEDLRKGLAKYAAWSIDRVALSSVTIRPGLVARVRVGAGTPLQVVSA